MTMNARKSKRGGGNSLRGHGGPMRGDRDRGHHNQMVNIHERLGTKDYAHADGVYLNARLMYAATSLVGCTIRAQLRSGMIYEGVLKCYSSKFELVLECAHQVKEREDSPPPKDKVVDKLVLHPSDVVTVTATGVDFDFAQHKDGFTDGAISGVKMNGDRSLDERGGGGGLYSQLAPLQPWDAEDVDDICLDESGESSGWDPNEMFRANAERFGVESSYDASLEQYTMPLLAKNTDEFRKREEEARKLAEEIESSSSYKERIAVENDDDDMDEEDKFSAVQRAPENPSTPSGREGKYLPPAFRKGSPAVAQGSRGGRASSDRHSGNSPQHRDIHAAPPPHHGYHHRNPVGAVGGGGRHGSPRAAVGGPPVDPKADDGGGRMRRNFERSLDRGSGGPHHRKSSSSYSEGKDSNAETHGGSVLGGSSYNGATTGVGPSLEDHHPKHHIPPISIVTSNPSTSRPAPISYSAAVASPTGSSGGGRSPVPPISGVPSTVQVSSSDPKTSPQQAGSQVLLSGKSAKSFSAAVSSAQGGNNALDKNVTTSDPTTTASAQPKTQFGSETQALAMTPAMNRDKSFASDRKSSNSKKPREEQIAELRDFSEKFKLQDPSESGAPKKNDEKERVLMEQPEPMRNAEIVDDRRDETNSMTEGEIPLETESDDAVSMASKSKLNPHAKEFTLNPLAKSFVPRPPSGHSSQPGNTQGQSTMSPINPLPQSPVTPQGMVGPAGALPLFSGPQYMPTIGPSGNPNYQAGMPGTVAYQGIMTYSPSQTAPANGNPAVQGGNPRFAKLPQHSIAGIYPSPRTSSSEGNGQAVDPASGAVAVIPQGFHQTPHMAFAPGHAIAPSNPPGNFPAAAYPQVYQVMGGTPQRMISPAMVAQQAVGSGYLLQHPATGNGGPGTAQNAQPQTQPQGGQQAQAAAHQHANNPHNGSPSQEPSAHSAGSNPSILPPTPVPNQVGNQSALNFSPQIFYQQQMQQQMLAHAHMTQQAQAVQAQNVSSQSGNQTSQQQQVVPPGAPGVPVLSQSGQLMYHPAVPMMAYHHHRLATAAANAGSPHQIQIHSGKQGHQPHGPGVGYPIQQPPPSHQGASVATQQHGAPGYPSSIYPHYAVASVPPVTAPPMSGSFTQASALSNPQSTTSSQ